MLILPDYLMTYIHMSGKIRIQCRIVRSFHIHELPSVFRFREEEKMDGSMICPFIFDGFIIKRNYAQFAIDSCYSRIVVMERIIRYCVVVNNIEPRFRNNSKIRVVIDVR